MIFNKIMFKLGRMIYMGGMILASIVLTFKTITIPAMYGVADVITGQPAFQACLLIGACSILVAGVIFYVSTGAIYSILVYVGKRQEGRHVAKHAAKVAFKKSVRI